MRKITFFKTILAAVLLFFAGMGVSAQLLVEDFNYPSGALLVDNGWSAHSGAGNASIAVTTPGLEFAGYAGSGIGGAANVVNNGEDVHRTFPAQTSGTVYAAFIIRTEATNSAGYFFHFGQTAIGTTFFTRVWVNATGDGVGIGTNAPASYIPITPGTPVMLVVKLDIASKVSSLFVLNSFTEAEPASANQTFTETASFSNVGSVALRQYNAAQHIVVDGIRVATSWSEAVAPATGTPRVSAPFITASGDLKAPDTYWNTASVTMGSSTEGASVYYTTNGTEPTTSSTLFTSDINITSTTTFRAIAVKSGMDNSVISEKTFVISPPATATIPYAEAFNNTLGDWYSFRKLGDRPWNASVNGATVNGFGGGDVESWLISPRFTAPASGIALSFNHASRFVGNPLIVKYSTNYTGFGDPAAAQWVTVATIAAPEAQDNSYTVKASGTIVASVTGDVHFALFYAADANYSDWRITNAAVDAAPAPNEPSIVVTEVVLPAFSAEVGSTDSKNITVNGVNLTGNISITVTGANAAMFSVNPQSIAPAAGTVTDVSVAVQYTPTASGAHTATLTLSSPGANDVTRQLSGTATAPPVQMTPPNVIITEVYGGGGNAGAPFKNDFIELYNTTNANIDLSGWSVQYYSATGTTANVIAIPDGKIIPAKGYFLISSAGGDNGVDLPVPDASGTVNMSVTAGKVVLLTTAEALTLTSATDINLIVGHAAFKDYVAYGTTATPVWGSSMANASNTTSASRKMIGENFSYTQNIGFDFEVVTPTPRNTGLTSVQNPRMELNAYISNGTLRIQTVAGQPIEVFNVIGQRIHTSVSQDGLNVIPLSQRGIVVVKVGSQIRKLTN